MIRAIAQRTRAKPARRVALVAALAVGLATAIGCGSESRPAARPVFDAEVLDALDAAMSRLAAGRWPSWSMRIQGGQLAFRVETGKREGNEAERRDCSAIAKLVQENAGGGVPWRAEITRGGRLVRRCSQAPAYDRHVG